MINATKNLLSVVPGTCVARPIRRDFNPVGRNLRCPCGSGRKFKRCCLARQSSEQPGPKNIPDELDVEDEIEETEIETCSETAATD